MAKAVVRTDRMFGTDNRAGIVSAQYVTIADNVATAAGAIENGHVLKLSGLASGEREIYNAVTPAANSAASDIILIASEEMMYDERKKNLDEFENASGAVLRGFRLHSGDEFGVTADALANASPAVGQVIELKAATKLNNVAALTTNSTEIGKIIAKEVTGRYTYYVIKVK